MEPRTSSSRAGGAPLLPKVKTQSIILLLFLVFLGCSTFSLKVIMCTNFAIASTTTYLNKIWQLIKNIRNQHIQALHRMWYKWNTSTKKYLILICTQNVKICFKELSGQSLTSISSSLYSVWQALVVYCLCKWRGQSLTLSVPHLSNSKWVYCTMLFHTNAAKHTQIPYACGIVIPETSPFHNTYLWHTLLCYTVLKDVIANLITSANPIWIAYMTKPLRFLW